MYGGFPVGNKEYGGSKGTASVVIRVLRKSLDKVVFLTHGMQGILVAVKNKAVLISRGEDFQLKTKTAPTLLAVKEEEEVQLRTRSYEGTLFTIRSTAVMRTDSKTARLETTRQKTVLETNVPVEPLPTKNSKSTI